LQQPGLLARLNQALGEGQLEPLQGQDFEDAGNRAIFEVWQVLLEAEQPNPVEAMWGQLPIDLHPQLEEMLAANGGTLSTEQLLRDVRRTLLRLRERSLKRLGQELTFLTREAQEAGDIRAEEYVGALQAYKETLLRTQQALAQQ
jgi:hypothetical protein